MSHPAIGTVGAVVELPEAARQLIEGGSYAHLATINPDGAPQVSLVWSTIEEGEICVASLTRTTRQKLRNVRRDPRVAISYQAPERDAMGMAYYLVVHGHARVTEGGAPELLKRIAPRYLHPGVAFPRGDDPPRGFVMRIEPVRWRGYGPWGDGPAGD
jgi:PPOX class probable F420-dependent enzyme